MKGFLRKVMLIASLGATLTFFGCQKDYTQDINKVREDLTAALEEQNQALTNEINSLREEARQYAEDAQAAAEAYADAAAAAAKAEAIEEAERLAQEALNAAKEYADDAAAKAAADAKAEVLKEIQEDLEQTLADAKSYTDAEIKALKSELEQKITELSSRIEGVAEELNTLKETVKKQGEQINDLIAMDSKLDQRLKALEDYKATVEDFIESTTKELKDLSDKLAALDTKHDEDIAKLREEIDGYVAELQEQIDTINNTILEIQGTIVEIQGQIKDLYAQVANTNLELEGLATYILMYEEQMKETLANLESELRAAIEAGDNAVKEELISKLNAAIDGLRTELKEYFNTELSELESQFNASMEEVKADLKAKYDELKSDIAELDAKIDRIESEIRQYINDAILGLEGKIGDRLTSISLIPETYVDGIPAISVPAIVYQTSLSIDDETEEMVYSDIYEIWSTARDYAYVRYHLSPAHVTVDGLKSAEYLIEKAQNVTKAYVDNDILSIDFDNLEVNDRNELVVPVKKVNSSSLYFETGESLNEFNYLFYSAALQLGIADELLLEGEKEANVVSEYSMVIEEPHIIHIAPLRDDSREIHGYECETFYYSYEEAQESEPAAFVNFDSELDLYTMVTSCIHNINSNLADPYDMPLSWLVNYLEDEGTEAAIDELRELGFEFRFIIPTVPFEIGDEKTDQQAFIKFKDGSDAVVVSTVPGEYINNEAAVGRTPVIRVELIDTNNDNEIVDVQWFKIRWVKQTIPAIDLGNVADFDYVLGCTDFSGSLNWKQINQYVLARLGVEDGNVTGISHKEFVDYYKQEGNENITWEAVKDEFEETENDITFNWDVLPDENPTTSVLTWNMTVEQIGEVIDKILENGSVQKQIKVTINPKAGEEDYAGAVTFTLTLNITFEDRPAILGYNEYFWNTPGQLAQVQPIGFNDATNEQPGVSDFVRFNYNVLDLFNKLEKYDAPETWMWNWGNGGKNVTNFMYNIDPTAEQVAAYAEKGYDLVRHWACRMWDIQFSADQTLDYAPKFANGQKFDPENGGELGYSLIRNGELDYSSKIVPNVMGLNWYSFIEQDLSEINFTLADDMNGDFEGAVALLNPANVTDENRKDVAVDIWVRINQFNYYKVSTFNVWFVEPVTLPEPTINGKLEDINMNPTSVTVANPFGTTSGLKDFQGELINSNEKLAYYGIYGPNWDTRGSEYILVDITEMTTEDGYTNITVNPNLNPNNPEDIAKMRTAAECKFDVKWNGNKLTVTNQTGHQLTQTCHLWVKASYGHAYGNFELWVPVEYVPNQN